MEKNHSIENVEISSKTQSTITLDVNSIKDEDYDPLQHRNLEHPTSTLGSFFHLLKSSLGSGLLAMPGAFMHAGIIPGCVGTVVVAFIATHCVQMLVTTSREVCKACHKSSLSYTDTCEEVFKNGPKKMRQYSTFARHFADYAMAGVCLGGTSVYVVFIASSIKDIVDTLAPDYQFKVESYCGMLLLPLILITQVRYLKFLVPFSVVANISLLVTFGITCWYTFDQPDLGHVELVGEVKNWPLFLSTAIFAMEGINVVMPVENEMKTPQHFLGCPGVLNVTMVFVACLYGTVGIFGYMKYGKNVQDTITLNLPKETLAMTAKVLVVVAVFFTYCLQMYAPMSIIWTRIQDRVSEKHHNLAQILQRTISVTFTVILAVAIPDLGLLIGLVGAIFFSTLGLLIPVVIETVHKWERGLGKYSYILWKNALLLVFYKIVLISGCYSAISAIVQKISGNYNV
ncbi:hypothetical protein O0L34_g9083 [Tuta absoluta]|nr:hypothetical protein O0L34_g9083 [Tuta absoluta]